MKLSQDKVTYALEQTKILHEPSRRIDTFNETRFRFVLFTELMDRADEVLIRYGEIEASKPKILKPEGLEEVQFEGFGDEGSRLLNWLKNQGLEPVFLEYGFQFKNKHIRDERIHESLEQVRGRVVEQVRKEGDPMMVVIESVEEAWQIGLLKFTIDMIEKSQAINHFDFKRKGFL